MTCIGDLRSRIAPLGPTPVLRQAVKWRTTARALMPQTLWPRDLRRATAAFVRYREQALRRRRERGFGAIPLASLRADVAAGSAVLEPWPLGWAFGEDHPASLQMRPGARAAYRITCEPGTRFEARVYVEPPHGTAEPPPLRFTLVATAGDGRTARFAKELERPGEVAVLSLELPASPRRARLELALAAVDEAQPHGHGVWIDPCLAGPYPGTPPARSRFPSARPRRASGQGVAASPGPEPRFSILLPVRDPDPVFLDRAIASVLSQTRPEWELCVADDASSDPDVRALLAAHVEREPRVSVRRSERPLGISGATNAALELARGEFVLLIDHDDEIEADSLAAFAAALGEFPDADLLYTDEAMIDGANRSLENFTKPAWSPRLFESNMYSCHLTALRRELVERLGGMRGEFDGSQDYDLVLRLSEATDRIVHVPGVRYYWRRHAGSASAGAKPYAYTAAKQALEEHFERSGRPGEVMPMNLPGCYRRSPARAAGAVAALLAVNDDDDAERSHAARPSSSAPAPTRWPSRAPVRRPPSSRPPPKRRSTWGPTGPPVPSCSTSPPRPPPAPTGCSPSPSRSPGPARAGWMSCSRWPRSTGSARSAPWSSRPPDGSRTPVPRSQTG